METLDEPGTRSHCPGLSPSQPQLPGQPGPIGDGPGPQVDGVALMVHHIHAPGEPDHGQRREQPHGQQEGDEIAGEHQPEGKQREHDTERPDPMHGCCSAPTRARRHDALQIG